MYRLFIEQTGKDYIRFSLQRQTQNGRRWKTQEREYCHAGNKELVSRILSGYTLAYKIAPHLVINTMVDYKGISWIRAIINELKLSLENYIWRKKFRRLKKHLIFLHKESGRTKHTRRKYWILTDFRGDPMGIDSKTKDAYKKKGWYSKQVDALTMDKECLWNTDSL